MIFATEMFPQKEVVQTCTWSTRNLGYGMDILWWGAFVLFILALTLVVWLSFHYNAKSGPFRRA